MSTKLEIRPLKGTDMFPIISLVEKLQLIGPLKEILTGEKRKKIIESVRQKAEGDDISSDNEQIGFEIIFELADIAVKRLPLAKDDMNALLADLCQTDIDTIQELSLKEYIGLIKSFFTHQDFKDLLKSQF